MTNISAGSNNNNYNKTHAGLCTGSIYVASALTIGGVGHCIATAATGNKSKKISKHINKALGVRSPWVRCPAFVAVAIGCGAIVDMLINNKRKKFAEETNGLTSEEVLKKNENAELNRVGKPYLKQSTGKIYGPLLGIVALPLLQFAKFKKPNALYLSSSAITGAVGGLILGAITDAFANKNVAK